MKILREIAETHSAFVTSWNQQSGVSPLYVLDGTPGSLILADLLSIHLRDGASRELFQGLLSYVAVFIGSVWEESGFSVELKGRDEEMSLLGKRETEELYLPIGEIISRILNQPPTSLRLAPGYLRNLIPPEGWLSPLLLSSALGSFPESHSSTTQEAAMLALGRGFVRYFERVFPGDIIGQIGEIYLSGGIFPLMGMDESFPALKSAPQHLARLLEFGFRPEEIRRYAEHLASIGEEHLSCIGFVIASALYREEVDSVLPALAERKGRFTGLLRPALIAVRAQLGIPSDWLEGEVFDATASRFFRMEKRLGYLPWVFFLEGEIGPLLGNELGKSLLRALTLFDYHAAQSFCERLILDDPKILGYRLQDIFLSMLSRDYDRAEQKVRAVLTEPNAEEDFRVHYLAGSIALFREDPEKACRFFLQAEQSTPRTSPEWVKITNDSGWAHLKSGKTSEAISKFQEVLSRDPNHLTAWLNLASAASALELTAERDRALQNAVRISPYDSRVFLSIFR